MTRYFDHAQRQMSRLCELEASGEVIDVEAGEPLAVASERVAQKVLQDCALVAFLFEDTSIPRFLVAHGLFCSSEVDPTEVAHEEESRKCPHRVRDMVRALHSMFHALCTAGVLPSDDPEACLELGIIRRLAALRGSHTEEEGKVT